MSHQQQIHQFLTQLGQAWNPDLIDDILPVLNDSCRALETKLTTEKSLKHLNNMMARGLAPELIPKFNITLGRFQAKLQKNIEDFKKYEAPLNQLINRLPPSPPTARTPTIFDDPESVEPKVNETMHEVIKMNLLLGTMAQKLEAMYESNQIRGARDDVEKFKEEAKEAKIVVKEFLKDVVKAMEGL